MLAPCAIRTSASNGRTTPTRLEGSSRTSLPSPRAAKSSGATVDELAARLAAQPPLAIRGARRAIDVAWYSDPHASFRVAVDAQIACIASDDFKEGRQSIVEGRSPTWRGK